MGGTVLQLTPPVWGRTQTLGNALYYNQAPTHAPRVGANANAWKCAIL